jgi:hypothetical protein
MLLLTGTTDLIQVVTGAAVTGVSRIWILPSHGTDTG